MSVFDETKWHECGQPLLPKWVGGSLRFLTYADRRRVLINGKWRWEYREREQTWDEWERLQW